MFLLSPEGQQGTGKGEYSLDTDTLHVLGTPGIDVALRILEGFKGVMMPMFLGAKVGRGAGQRIKMPRGLKKAKGNS